MCDHSLLSLSVESNGAVNLEGAGPSALVGSFCSTDSSDSSAGPIQWLPFDRLWTWRSPFASASGAELPPARASCKLRLAANEPLERASGSGSDRVGANGSGALCKRSVPKCFGPFALRPILWGRVSSAPSGSGAELILARLSVPLSLAVCAVPGQNDNGLMNVPKPFQII